MTALIEAAHAGARKKDSYFSYFKDEFFRLKARRGYLRAAVAIARKILKAVYVIVPRVPGSAPSRFAGRQPLQYGDSAAPDASPTMNCWRIVSAHIHLT
jgi:hypothetical protein